MALLLLFALRGCAGPRPLQRRPILQSGPLQARRSLLRHAIRLRPLPVRRSGLGRALSVGRAWLRLTGTVLSGRPVRPWLARLIAAIVVQARIGAAERALLGDDLAADGLRGVHLAHKSLIALRLSRRDRKRHRRKARAAAHAGADGEAARALRQRAEPRARPVIDLDPSDPAVGVGIEL